MIKRTFIGIVAAVVLVAGGILAAEGLYTVTEMEQAVVTQFQKIVRVSREPGIHWKVPFIQDVHYLDKRLLEWDGNPKQIPTRGKKYITVNTWARWRIVDPRQFFVSVRTEQRAQSQLDDQIETALRNKVSSLMLEEVIRSTSRKLQYVTEEIEEAQKAKEEIDVGRPELMNEIEESAGDGLRENYGIELQDVRIKRINYIERVREDVYARMRSERERIAVKYLSEARSEKNEILGKMNQSLQTIRSEGYAEAEETKGEADAKAADVYAETYGKNLEFYEYLTSLETYEETMDQETFLLLGLDSGYFRFL
ncbi:MAG: protease modulator HflC, partial [Planctomycetota bacterium]